MLQLMGLQSVRHDLVTQQHQLDMWDLTSPTRD